MKKRMTVLDFIQAAAKAEREGRKITREEFTYIRHYGTREELAEAVERMEAAGGYENLE
jgi:hypothetical protein